MSTYPNLTNEPDLLKIKTKDNGIKELKYRTEEHDYENLLKSLKSDNDYHKKKYKKLTKKSIYDRFRNFIWLCRFKSW